MVSFAHLLASGAGSLHLVILVQRGALEVALNNFVHTSCLFVAHRDNSLHCTDNDAIGPTADKR
jgi:hypothetical protein